MSSRTTAMSLFLVLVPAVLAAHPPTQADINAALINDKVVNYIAWTWGLIILVVLIYRWSLRFLQHVRKLANLNHSDGTQRFFAIPNNNWAAFKRQMLTAPLFRRRHNREFKLSTAINVGTLPGRMQTFFLVGYFALNITFTLWDINWNSPTFYSLGIKRTGVLAVLNMVPLFLLAGRNNPLIWLLGISFNDFNMIHRWIGRIVIFEAAAHFGFWITKEISKEGANAGSAIAAAMTYSTFILTGTVAFAAFALIFFQACSVVRHAFYETFLHLHIALALTAVVTVWMHLNGRPQQMILLAAIVVWVIDRLARIFLIVHRNFNRGGKTKAEIEALPGDAVRVTLRMAKPWKFQPGQHVYLYIPSIGMLTSHPFSLAWGEESTDYPTDAALPMARHDALAATKTASSISLVIRRRTGFTDSLYKKAEASQSGPLSVNAFVEGPYGHQSFQSYGTVMLFAAGVGITHQVPHVRDLVAAYANKMCATRKVTLIWVIQSPEHLEWIRPWMTQILGMEKRREVLKILLFVTRPRSTKEIHSPSASVQMFPGKPDVGALISKEQESQIGAMAISVCGTGALSDDIRKETRDRSQYTEIDFFEEAFTW